MKPEVKQFIYEIVSSIYIESERSEDEKSTMAMVALEMMLDLNEIEEEF